MNESHKSGLLWPLASVVGMVFLLAGCGSLADTNEAGAPPAVVTPPAVTTARTEPPCVRSESASLRGALPRIDTLADFGGLGAAVLVVHTKPGPPKVSVDPDRNPVVPASPPEHPTAAPYVVTSYGATVEQVVIWPDSATVPKLSAQIDVEVSGGTVGCFTLVVENAITLQGDTSYLIAATPTGPTKFALVDDSNALKVEKGLIDSSPSNAYQLPQVLKSLGGLPVSSLSLSIVPVLKPPPAG